VIYARKAQVGAYLQDCHDTRQQTVALLAEVTLVRSPQLSQQLSPKFLEYPYAAYGCHSEVNKYLCTVAPACIHIPCSNILSLLRVCRGLWQTWQHASREKTSASTGLMRAS
jgi:hypothetical protein